MDREAFKAVWPLHRLEGFAPLRQWLAPTLHFRRQLGNVWRMQPPPHVGQRVQGRQQRRHQRRGGVGQGIRVIAHQELERDVVFQIVVGAVHHGGFVAAAG